MATKSCEEESFSAEKHALQIASTFDVVIDRWWEAHKATRVDAERFAFQFFFDDVATSVDKRHAIPLEFLENKSFTSKETGTNFTIECDGNSRAEGGTKEGILLAQQAQPRSTESHRK